MEPDPAPGPVPNNAVYIPSGNRQELVILPDCDDTSICKINVLNFKSIKMWQTTVSQYADSSSDYNLCFFNAITRAIWGVEDGVTLKKHVMAFAVYLVSRGFVIRKLMLGMQEADRPDYAPQHEEDNPQMRVLHELTSTHGKMGGDFLSAIVAYMLNINLIIFDKYEENDINSGILTTPNALLREKGIYVVPDMDNNIGYIYDQLKFEGDGEIINAAKKCGMFRYITREIPRERGTLWVRHTTPFPGYFNLMPSTSHPITIGIIKASFAHFNALSVVTGETVFEQNTGLVTAALLHSVRVSLTPMDSLEMNDYRDEYARRFNDNLVMNIPSVEDGSGFEMPDSIPHRMPFMSHASMHASGGGFGDGFHGGFSDDFHDGFHRDFVSDVHHDENQTAFMRAVHIIDERIKLNLLENMDSLYGLLDVTARRIIAVADRAEQYLPEDEREEKSFFIQPYRNWAQARLSYKISHDAVQLLCNMFEIGIDVNNCALNDMGIDTYLIRSEQRASPHPFSYLVEANKKVPVFVGGSEAIVTIEYYMLPNSVKDPSYCISSMDTDGWFKAVYQIAAANLKDRVLDYGKVVKEIDIEAFVADCLVYGYRLNEIAAEEPVQVEYDMVFNLFFNRDSKFEKTPFCNIICKLIKCA